MKFTIRRTSEWDDEVKPCEEAFMDQYTKYDRRTTSKPNDIPFYKNYPNDEWWYSEGQNHRIENGNIVRDFVVDGWCIQINSLIDLEDFINEYGDIVVKPAGIQTELPGIEIYDCCRE